MLFSIEVTRQERRIQHEPHVEHFVALLNISGL
jgi:hypothetical protein